MLTKAQLEKYADVMVWALQKARSGNFRKGDVVRIAYHPLAEPLINPIFERILDNGWQPYEFLLRPSSREKLFYEKASGRQLSFHAPGRKQLCNRLNGSIIVRGLDSLTHLKHIDPKKIGEVAQVDKTYREILDIREAKGLFGWTLCDMSTKALAQEARMTLKEYEEQIIRACYLDEKNPIAKWQEFFDASKETKKWLDSMDVKYYHIETENMDLRVVPGPKRRWLGGSGHNIPSFELFLSPDFRYIEGTYYANQPSFRTGNYVEWLKLRFEKGTAVEIKANPEAQEFVDKILSIDEGAKRIGEFSLTDNRFSRINRFMANTLFDENYGGAQGNCHIAMGSAYGDSYTGDQTKLNKGLKKRLGFNDSALHWDIVNSEKKKVTAHLRSGKEITIYENGRFTSF